VPATCPYPEPTPSSPHENVHTVKEKEEALVVASKESGQEVNADKYMVMSRVQNTGRCHSMKTGNTSFERAKEFKYLGTNLNNQNSIQEEIKGRLKSWNAYYHSAQNLLSSNLLSKNLRLGYTEL
jgi:hypothetical protein